MTFLVVGRAGAHRSQRPRRAETARLYSPPCLRRSRGYGVNSVTLPASAGLGRRRLLTRGAGRQPQSQARLPPRVCEADHALTAPGGQPTGSGSPGGGQHAILVCSASAHAAAWASCPGPPAATAAGTAGSRADGQACQAFRALDAVLEPSDANILAGISESVMSLMQLPSPVRPAASRPPPTPDLHTAGAEDCPSRR